MLVDILYLNTQQLSGAPDKHILWEVDVSLPDRLLKRVEKTALDPVV